jgi:biopolymer transport protein ExbD
MRKRNSNPDQTSEVDMTPMLDIVFIMLIFFIVTTSFVKESGITIDRPSKTKEIHPIPVTNTLVIQINQLEDVFFAGRLILQDTVQANIEVALSKNPNVVILVKVDESVGSGILVNVVDQVKLAGISQVTVSRI